MIKSLDHIAVAVSDLEAAVRRFAEDFSLPCQGTEKVPSAQTTTAFFPAGDGVKVELIHPLEGKGPVQKYLMEKGRGGLHHLCFTSDNLDADVARLKKKGYVFVTEEPFVGAHGCRVIFIHPKSCDGVLIELNQPAGE